MKKIKFKSKILAILFFSVNLFFVNSSMAQNILVDDSSVLSQSSNIQPVEEFEEGNYVVRIIKLQTEGYGYEILENNKLIIRQESRPYFLIPTPFVKIENVRIAAKWHISQIKEHGVKKLEMTIEIAKQLGFNNEDLTINKSNKN